MRENIYLIDSNSLITPSRTYYQFSLAPSFWDNLGEMIVKGDIAVLDLVKKEIENGNDELALWFADIKISNYIDRREEGIVAAYREVLEHVRTNPCYKTTALKEWSRATSADPWLIACARNLGYTIVTFEGQNNNLNRKNPSKRALIPDVAEHFDIKVCDLFGMMKDLGFSKL